MNFPPPNPGTAQSTAYNMMSSFGFDPKTQFGCLNNIWTRESGWRYNAENASGAYGIPQALPGSKMASAGADWQTNPATQIKWGLGYIKSVYGTPCNAWAFWEGHFLLLSLRVSHRTLILLVILVTAFSVNFTAWEPAQPLGDRLVFGSSRTRCRLAFVNHRTRICALH